MDGQKYSSASLPNKESSVQTINVRLVLAIIPPLVPVYITSVPVNSTPISMLVTINSLLSDLHHRALVATMVLLSDSLSGSSIAHLPKYIRVILSMTTKQCVGINGNI